MKILPRQFGVPLALCLALTGRSAAQPAGTPENANATPPAAAKETAAAAIPRIRDEGLNRSQVMATLSHLTDVIGPRLTGSPGLRRASAWSRDQFTSWGLANAHLEPWGPFGRGWTLRRFSAQVIAPQSIPLIAFPKAWSPGLGAQPLESEVVHVDITKSEDFELYRGKLRGLVVLDGAVVEMKVGFDPLANRRTEANLLALANAGEGASSAARPSSSGATSSFATPEGRAAMVILPSKYQFFADEGVALLLQPSRQGESGTLFTASATVYPTRGRTPDPAPAGRGTKKGGDSGKKSSAPGGRPIRPAQVWKADAPPIIPQVTVAAEHYNRLVRMTQRGEKLRVAVELQADYHTDDLMEANVLAEIPGSDRADEVVMLGAHLDSWHSGTGATDNAAGSAGVMEAVRILQALELKPRRTIRVALWTGEEQGLLGSKAYVASHFGEIKAPATTSAAGEPDPFAIPARNPVGPVVQKPGYRQLSAYFNLDNGGGKIRGVYLQGNEAVRPLFRDWLKPFRDLGAETVSFASTGSTDHVSFDAIGLPGFQFIQDNLEYWTRTHHANMDVYDRVIAEDLKQAAVIMATFVYHTAMRDEILPRKPAPAAPAPTTTAAAGVP